MSLKLAISGKGGVGKSTVCGVLARLYAASGRPVLAIDADPDANLAAALGVPADLLGSIRTISEERRLVEERTGAKANQYGQVFTINPDVSGIAEQYAVRHAGVDLLVLGGIPSAGGGCNCPESVLLKSLVRELVLKRDDVVLLDMEAGIEHLGRGTAMGVDLMLAVVEPGRRSVDTAARVQHLAAGIGIRQFAVVINKATNPEADRQWVSEVYGDACILGVIPYDPRIGEADRSGRSVVDLHEPELLEPFQAILQAITDRYERSDTH